ncbi:related to phosphatidylinositol phosphate phosphatase [Rhynchosporium graminicola]|uniref:Related to phosphatidylinositol phosphate phosphatase n=1 Tax=Rhynchosporium graminicola TaxID=2792576 RepID=A0A1E1KJJ1_9HELO|nr:related to phosphatidylinositol phosphate phosphatase [Rhynchosporium commune]
MTSADHLQLAYKAPIQGPDINNYISHLPTTSTNDTSMVPAIAQAISLYILTYNCGKALIDVDAVASQLFSGLSKPKLPDLLVLSLQEIAPIPQCLIGGSFLVQYFNRFHEAVEKASRGACITTGGNEGLIYHLIAARNLGMTGIMIFARDPSAISDVETGGVGVGMAEMGNKGAIGVRFTYHGNGTSAELTFVAAHLAAMESDLTRRNEDWRNIVRGLIFSSKSVDRKSIESSRSAEERPLLSISPRDASIFKPTSHLFLAGDLNYRTSILSPSPTDHKDTFPQPYHDRSSPQHFSKLFKDDQLNQERLAGRTCHGLTEAPVTFPPTYKYDPKEAYLTPDEDLSRWHWAKHRWPSWCDRILYLEVPSWVKRSHPEAQIITHKYSALPLWPTSDHRAVALDVSVPILPIPPPKEDEEGDDPRIHPPFEINIDWKAKRKRARALELVVGFAMYFTTTLEGGGVSVAMVLGAVGAFFAIKAMVEM